MSNYVGVVSTPSGTYGFIQSISLQATPNTAESKNKDGKTKRRYYFENEMSVQIEAEFTADTTVPENGDNIGLSACKDAKFNRDDYAVDDVSINEQNEQYMTLSISATTYLELEKEVTFSGS